GQWAGLFHFALYIHLQARVRDDSAFLGEAFNVFCFPREVTQRNKKREVSVAMTSGAEHRVELTLHVFPNSVSPRTNHHATPYVRGLGQFRGANHLLIPFRKVFVPARCNRSLRCCVGHGQRIKRAKASSPASISVMMRAMHPM